MNKLLCLILIISIQTNHVLAEDTRGSEDYYDNNIIELDKILHINSYKEKTLDREGNFLLIGQIGDFNFAAVLQEGNLNRSLILQAGDMNRATLSQTGDANLAEISQWGGQHAASVSQNGHGNMAIIVQR